MPDMGSKDTPPPSPGIPVTDDGDEMFEDDIAEEIDDADGVMQGDIEDELNEEDDDELVELPGGIDQLEALIEEHENRIVDSSKLVFSKHNGSVFCCSLNTGAGLVATGGEDDLGYVWNVKDGEVQFTMEGWGDSVTSMAWSADNTLLAACDMAGAVKVWRVPGYQLVWSFDLGQDVLWLRWHPVAAVLLAGTAEGQLWLWRLPGGDSKVMGGGERVECGEVLADGKRAVCGYSDGSVRLWDLRGGEVQQVMTGGHKDTITTVVGHGGREVVLSGSMDSTVNIWNCNSGKSVGMLMCGEAQVENSPSSVECLVVGKDYTAVTGTLSGVVAVWDLASQVERCKMKVGEGVTVIKATENLVYAGTLEGAVRAIDIRTGAAVNEWTGNKGSVLDLELGEVEGTLVTASDDGTARIFDVRLPD